MLGRALSVMVVIWYSQACLASGDSGKQSIEKMYEDGVTGLVSIYAQDSAWANPDNCSSNEMIVLKRSHRHRKELYTAILGAHLAKREISATLSGCAIVSDISYPIIRDLNVF